MKVQVKPLSTKASIIASGVLAQRISSSVRTARLRADAGTEGAHRGKEAETRGGTLMKVQVKPLRTKA